MRVSACLSAVVVALAVVACRPMVAQSLGDVAKQEEDRRKDVKPSAKVYTNKDLGAPISSASAPDAAKPSGDRPAAPPPADKAKDGSKDPAKDEFAKDQKYWSSRRKDLQPKRERDKWLADAMQSRVNGLTADCAARSAPAQ